MLSLKVNNLGRVAWIGEGKKSQGCSVKYLLPLSPRGVDTS